MDRLDTSKLLQSTSRSHGQAASGGTVPSPAIIAAQIQTSSCAVRSPPSAPVLRTPRGSISINLTSWAA